MKKLLTFFSIPVFITIVFISSCTPGSIDKPADQADNTTERISSKAPDVVVTSVAKVTDIAGGLEILFNERHAVYVIYSGNPRYQEVSNTARQALALGKPIKLTSTQSGTITNLTWPSSGETAAYLEWYTNNLIDVDTARKLNLAQIDPVAFNMAINQKWKALNLCYAISNFAAVQALFNYCKQQTCGTVPTQVTPCIPFSYVRDGCFSRAHKMRYIIESIYHYCSVKVFSFGRLRVNASLWGGCCVGWWFHVAPMVSVKINGQVICYVIDPGMFTGPVTLSTWLNAQANTSCDASAGVHWYAIQPSSAYTPAGNLSSNTYSTDANYTDTDASLTGNRNAGTTCPN